MKWDQVIFLGLGSWIFGYGVYQFWTGSFWIGVLECTVGLIVLASVLALLLVQRRLAAQYRSNISELEEMRTRVLSQRAEPVEMWDALIADIDEALTKYRGQLASLERRNA